MAFAVNLFGFTSTDLRVWYAIYMQIAAFGICKCKCELHESALRWVGHYILSPESLDCMTGDPKATSAVPEKELLELTQYTVFDLHLFLWVNHLFTFLKLREIKSRTLQELLWDGIAEDNDWDPFIQFFIGHGGCRLSQDSGVTNPSESPRGPCDEKNAISPQATDHHWNSYEHSR